ncbi:hypothetical protein ACLKA6_012343 [Drosophila palustris]
MKSLANQVQQQQEKDNKQDQKVDVQETIEEKDCVGHTENDTDNGGHQGVAETKKTVAEVELKQTKEKRKQIRTNDKRTLGEAKQNKLKHLKAIDSLKDSKQNESVQQEQAELESKAKECQHMKEPKTKEKSKQTKPRDEEVQNERTGKRVADSKSCLDMFNRNPSEFLRRYITMDDTWIHHYIPESNRSSAEWREAGESRSKRVKASRWAALWEMEQDLRCDVTVAETQTQHLGSARAELSPS